MKRNVLTLIIGAVLLVIFALLLFVFQVRKSEVAVVTTFGRPVANLTDPGAYFKWPWPVQNVYKFDQRVQNFEDKFSQTYTKDNFTILTSVYVGWKINDASAFFRQIPGASLPAAQQLLENIVRNAKNERIGKHALSEFVNTDPQEVKFEAIEQEIEAAVKNQLSTNNYRRPVGGGNGQQRGGGGHAHPGRGRGGGGADAAGVPAKPGAGGVFVPIGHAEAVVEPEDHADL